jgi:hypothetical protein
MRLLIVPAIAESHLAWGNGLLSRSAGSHTLG